jgi:aspartyl-tRNA(Asn)/glutamyl-tRNA(Gln) amidotransferase subunit A
VDLTTMSAGCLADAVNKGELKARDLVEKVLGKIEALNCKFNIFSSLAGEEALEQAVAIDNKVKSGICLPLAGVPLVIKDDIMYKALPTSLGSKQFKKFIAPYSAAAVEKIAAAGAVIMGKTNIDNMGIGSTTLNSPLGPTLNPRFPARVAGSAGAAALAAGICSLALESDSGGALRHGASNCGVFGLLPSAGMVSRHGLAMHSGSFGRVGLAALFMEDLPVALKIISGYDLRDVATVAFNNHDLSQEKDYEANSLKIGFPSAVFNLLDQPILKIFQEVLGKLKNADLKTVELDLKHLPEALRAYQVIAAAEASSTLSRFDGIRYGEAVAAEELEELYFKTRKATFSKETIRRSIFGTYFLSKSGYNRYYSKALQVWKMVREELESAFKSCDLLLMPAVGKLPPLPGEKLSITDYYENDLFTAPASMGGNPVICIPAGSLGEVPIGIQLIAPYMGDLFLLSTAAKLVPVVTTFRQELSEGGI